MRAFILLAALAGLSPSAHACNDHAPGTEPTRRAATKPSSLVAGHVREVDIEEGTITLGHGKIASPRMDAMSSMMFKAKDPAAIAKLKPGDRVRFRAVMVGRRPTITEIRIAPK